MTSKKLYTLQQESTPNFKENLKKLLELIDSCEEDSIVLAPEVVLSGFCYDRMEEAAAFGVVAKDRILERSKSRAVGLTLIEKIGDEFFNTFYLFYKGQIVHRQSKYRLFLLGDEHNNFKNGELEDISFFYIDDIKCATLICFELRFTELWSRVRGAEIIFVPAAWGLERKEHYEILTSALAISNQAFVVASDSGDKNMAKGSGIISPFGKSIRDDDALIIEGRFDRKELELMRRYINVGIDTCSI